MGLRISLIVAVLLAATGCSAAPNRSRPFPASTADRLDSAVAEAMRAARIPGAMVGIWSPDGDYVKAFGIADTADGTPMQTDFYSRIGSVTKTFTATAVLQLAADGRLGLDDPVSRYVDGVPGGEAITVRQLAAMRSGLADYLDNPDFGTALTADPTRAFTPRELLGWAFARPPVFPPGQKYQYSNTNYILLGLVVERVGGEPLPDYLSGHVFVPLGLSHTSFPTGTQFPDPHARGYTAADDDRGPPVDATDWSASFTGAAGAIISTLDDLRTWLPALANGTLLSADLQQQRMRFGSITDPAGGPVGQGGVGYGLGIATTAGWIGHNGSLPGYQTIAFHLKERKTTMVVIVNTDVDVPGGGSPDNTIAKAVTAIITPDHIYDL